MTELNRDLFDALSVSQNALILHAATLRIEATSGHLSARLRCAEEIERIIAINRQVLAKAGYQTGARLAVPE